MQNAITISQAIIIVLKKINKPTTPIVIYRSVLDNLLYDFKAKDPVHVVRSTLRRHCKNIAFSSASKGKHFYITDDKKFGLIEWLDFQKSKTSSEPSKQLDIAANNLRFAYKTYDNLFRARMLEQLKSLTGYEFECFARNFLKEFGFTDMEVTPKTHDGGIDGYGKIKIGLAKFSVCFECKRWKRPVGPDKVGSLRGRIVGLFDQGYFFTTSRFTAKAKKEASREGAMKIALIDGMGIVDLLLEKEVGVERRNAFPIYDNAIDLLLSSDD